MKKTNYSRIFTELLPYKTVLSAVKQVLKKIGNPFSALKKPFKITILITSFILFLFLAFTSYYLFDIFQNVKVKRVERQNHAFYWQNILQRHPEYPDAYYVLAWDLYSLGDRIKAVSLLNQVLFLDPNFKQAEILRDKLISGK